MAKNIFSGAIMGKNTESDRELLLFLLQKCNMTLENAKSEKEEMTNRQYLEKHLQYSKVWQGKDGRWRTHLPDKNRKEKRRLIAKSTFENLNAAIISFYREQERSLNSRKITLRTFYQSWLEYKKLKTTSTMYIYRIHNDWQAYYLNDTIIDVPLSKLNYDRLEQWALKKIREKQLTKKQYYNMSIIMRQSLDYAVQKGIIDANPFNNVKIDRKLFFIKKKPDDETQVFLTNEQPLIEAEAYADFRETENVACLAIPLLYQTGLRLGEIVAVKTSDISGNYLHVQRMEVRTKEQLPDGSWSVQRYKIVEHTKSDAGDRLVYLSKTARTIIAMVEQSNHEHGYKDDGFLFLNQQGRIHARCIDTRIRKYCRHAGIMEKASHKVRKTYISTLIDAGININEVRKQAGHEDERTTYKNYCFNRMAKSETESSLEKALAH